MTEIENEFHQAMLYIYKKAKEECHYNATYFLQMVEERGGLQAAKRLLINGAPQDGFIKLWELGRLDLSMESVVLSKRFRSLFTEVELKVAKERLEEYRYEITDR